MQDQNDERALEYIRIQADLASKRSALEQQWNEVAYLMSPNDADSFQGQTLYPGQKKNLKIYDSTAVIAVNRFVALMDALLTPHTQKYQRLTTDDPILNRNHEVRDYFDRVNNLIFQHRYSDEANFMDQNQGVWRGDALYGTSGLFTDQQWGRKGIRYKNIHTRELFFTENHQGDPDSLYRRYNYTARQAMQVWGDKCPEVIREKVTKNPEELYYFLQVIKPREDYEPGRYDSKGMKWMSCDVSITGAMIMQEGGYRTFPCSISRFSKLLDTPYGGSPAMDVLPTVKSLNEEKKSMLVQAHRILNPVWLTHDDGIMSGQSVAPGSQIPGGVNADGRALVHALPTGNIQVGKDTMEDDRETVKDTFLLNLFQLLMNTTKEMSATEVLEWAKEKGMLIGPTLARQERYISHITHRELDILNSQGLMPPMPRMLIQAGGLYNIRFESPLAKMRRAEELVGIERMFSRALNIAQATQDPTPLYYFNLDNIIPDMAEIEGVAARWINSPEVVAVRKQQLAQEKQAQQMIQAAPGAAQIIKATQGLGSE